MRRLFRAILVVFALNFLALAGGVAYLHQTGRIDRAKLSAIREVLFPPPAPPAPTTRPIESPATTQPVLRLEELLAQQAGRPPTEQLEFIRQSFDAQKAQLERSHRELLHLQGQVLTEKNKLAADRAAFDEEKKNFATREQETQRLAGDRGFQDTLAVYQSMSSKQVKGIFMTLDEPTVVQYLQAMEPRAAARITKEFKTPEELDRIKRVLEKMRQSQASAKE